MSIMAVREWQAPDQLKINREPGFGYRYVKKLDVERRIDEGWEIVESPLKVHKEGGPVDRAQHYRGLILMRMPKEMVDARNAHYRNLHNRRLRAVARGAHMSSIGRASTSEGHETADGRPLAGVIGTGLKVHQGVNTDEGLTHSDNMEIPLTAHPDDLREDLKVAEEMQKDQAAEHGEEGVPAKAPAKAKSKRR